MSANYQYEGIWNSEYTYFNLYRNVDMVSQHYVRMHREGKLLLVEGIKGANKSYLVLRLTLDGDLATGSWQEVTDPEGDFKGVVYNGVAQFIVTKDHQILEGKWLAAGQAHKINNGTWTIRYFGESLKP
jgi:hypothetical protein